MPPKRKALADTDANKNAVEPPAKKAAKATSTTKKPAKKTAKAASITKKPAEPKAPKARKFKYSNAETV